MSCTDKTKSYKAYVLLEGSGAPKAKYRVVFKVTDLINDGRAPKLRLQSYNQDGSFTSYKWRTGRQGRNVITNFPESTLQQPKGLHTVYLKGSTTESGTTYFDCGDYAPK